jgi:Family of unknown function (DUF6370)
MNRLFLISFVLVSSILFAQVKKNQNPQIVEVSCGQCQFGMKDKKGCNLAVRIEGNSYFVEGTKIDDHGDAHSHDGFCEAIRKAEVVGEVKDIKFIVSYFKLLPFEKK